ncbi:VPLPA-CTERM sorting domain-containing protein [Frigidibacter oleivorans]|uniref:VPLPA-CTERM sorting domain-containing protein n=1 Tax=Frigidibacter oleivorans TaxID=2487129 RepID=UPI0013E0D273|nr:VPLPA-CTERM sorting domain-containing protein [Frigidibacter oleivorans]
MRLPFYAPIALLVAMAGPAAASTWQLSFEGEITSITEYAGSISTETRGTYNYHGDSFGLGQTFTGTITITDEVQPSSTLADDPARDIYPAVIDLSLTTGGLTWSMGSTYPSYAQVWNDDPDFSTDLFSAGGNTYDRPIDLGPGADLSGFTLHLSDHTESVFGSTELDAALEDLAGYENAVEPFDYFSISFLQFSQGGGVEDRYVFWDGTVTQLSVQQMLPAPVPLPASLPLLVVGLGALAALRRRRG